MSDYHTTALLFLTTTVLFGLTFLAYAQTTDVRRHFDFGGSYNVRNVNGLSIGTTTINAGGITFGDGTVFDSSDAAASWTSTSTGIFYNGGNVGIGVDSPSSLLDVSGNIYGTTFYDYNNTSYYVNPSGGTSAEMAGDVGIQSNGSPVKMLEIGNKSSTNNPVVGSLRLEGGGNSGGNWRNWDFEVGPTSTSTSGYNTHRLRISNNGIEVMTIDQYGRLGINTTSPNNKLHVAGNINAGGNRILNVGTPTAGSDAATKSYVDSTAGGGVQSGSTSGETLRWDGSQWVGNYNLYNDGNQVIISTTTARFSNADLELGDKGTSTLTLTRDDGYGSDLWGILKWGARTHSTSYGPRITGRSNRLFLHGSGNGRSGDVVIIPEKGGSEALRADGSGNVSIGGDSSPDTTLDVHGNTYSNTYYDQDNDSYYINPSNSGTAVNVNGAIKQAGRQVFRGSRDAGDTSLDNLGEGVWSSTNTSNPPYSNHWVMLSIENVASTERWAQLWFGDTPNGGVWWRPKQGSTTGWHPWMRLITEDDSGFVGIGVTDADAKLDVDGGNLDMNSNDVLNADKIDANTVDPVYNIGGSKYATYMAGMTGVKEETTGRAILRCEKRQGADCEYTIDFEHLERGSDLWLFAHTSDFGEDWRDLRVIVSPREEAGVWSGGYSLDPVEGQLTLHAEPIEVSKPVSELTPEVSYRLTAPRFDAEKWGNRYQGESEGMTVPMK